MVSEHLAKTKTIQKIAMEKNAIKGGITIDAPASKIWEVLTQPAQIAKYLGSQTKTDWKVGSPITWEGEMNGAKFQNKGQVIQHRPGQFLQFSYWSGMGGDPDVPHNYSVISYELRETDKGKTHFSYTRIKIPTEMEKQVFESFLPSMLDEIKLLSE